MNPKSLKSSVVIEPYESRRLSAKDDSKTNLSTIVRSESSGRKWKVSESITPVMSEFDRFSLRIASENSFNNRSYGSFNESFEKNLQFNLQNSMTASYSSESRNKKVSIASAPLIKSVAPNINTEINVIRDTQTLIEVDNENEELDYDVDDVYLSSFSDGVNDGKTTDNNCDITNNLKTQHEDDIQSNSKLNITDGMFVVPQVTGSIIKSNGNGKIKKETVKFPAFIQPVDIDGSQSSVIQHQTIPKQSSDIEQACAMSDSSSYQQSKLCDTSKAYILSQESSLISSPMDRDILKSVVSLPGRTSNVHRNSISTDLPTPVKQTHIFKREKEDIKRKSPFYKSTFNERRIQEMNKLCNSTEIIVNKVTPDSVKQEPKSKTKSKPKPKAKPKQPKEKKTKPAVKKTKRQKRETDKGKEDNVFTVDSNKVQVKNIVIEDSENEHFDYPIEKARCDPNGSDDDLFTFTPEIVPKRKRKLPRKSQVKTKRQSKASTVYDIISDISSPSPVRLSYHSMKSTDRVTNERFGDQIVGRRVSLKNVVAGFESDLEQMKILHQSMTYQLNQFKEMAKNIYSQSP